MYPAPTGFSQNAASRCRRSLPPANSQSLQSCNSPLRSCQRVPPFIPAGIRDSNFGSSNFRSHLRLALLLIQVAHVCAFKQRFHQSSLALTQRIGLEIRLYRLFYCGQGPVRRPGPSCLPRAALLPGPSDQRSHPQVTALTSGVIPDELVSCLRERNLPLSCHNVGLFLCTPSAVRATTFSPVRTNDGT